VVRSVSTANVVAWTQGRIVFDNTALADAIDQINRYGGKPIMLDATAMRDERISGTFEVSDPQSFAAAVTAFLPLQQRSDEAGRIHLAARK
jgi:transmembrane sensor